MDGISVGSLIVHVVYIDFDGPVACQVGYKREKGVAVYGPTDRKRLTNRIFLLNIRSPILIAKGDREIASGK